MTSTALETTNGRTLAPRVATAAHVGQATAVEQSRAVAQVEAQVVVARRFPRSVTAAVEAMRETCKQPKLAEKAFFRFPRGGQTVNGPSIHLARELARVWGNLDYGIAELIRDDDRGQSEMLAFAWDLETNTRNSTTFINPHVRDKRDGPERLTEVRDIYESNANAGARRVREAIFAVLPTWFVEEAEDLCTKTLMDGGGKPLAQRVADALAAFAAQGVTQGQLEGKLGRQSDKWIEQDVAQLQVIYRSLVRGEISRDEEFPEDRATAADIMNAPRKPAPAQAGQPATTAEAAQATPQQVKRAQAALGKVLAKYPLGDAPDVAEFLAWRTGKQAPEDMEAAELQAVAAYLDDALEAAQGNYEDAAGAIWAEHHAAREATDGSAKLLETGEPG